MKIQSIRNLFKLIILTSFLGFWLLASAHANPDKPVAVAVPGSHDFGSVNEGAVITHDFIIKNSGKSNLEIQKVESG